MKLAFSTCALVACLVAGCTVAIPIGNCTATSGVSNIYGAGYANGYAYFGSATGE